MAEQGIDGNRLLDRSFAAIDSRFDRLEGKVDRRFDHLEKLLTDPETGLRRQVHALRRNVRILSAVLGGVVFVQLCQSVGWEQALKLVKHFMP